MTLDETETPEIEVEDEVEAEEAEAEEEAEIEEEEEGENDDTENETSEEEPEEEISVVVDGDDEVQEEQETPVIRTLRKQLREAKKALKEKERATESAARAAELPPKPTLKDFDYDDAKFASALEEWVGQKAEHDRKVQEEQARQTAMQEEYKQREAAFKERGLGLPDFDEAEAIVEDVFTPTQRGMMIDALDAPENVILALSRRPQKLKELASIEHPVRFIAALVKLEGNTTVTRKPKTTPEKRVAGKVGGAGGGSLEKQLERARLAAEKSGDYTDVRKLKAQLRQA